MDGSPRSERLQLRFVTHAETHLLNKRYAHEPDLRGAQFRAGGYHDLLVFSRIRSDPP